MLSDTVAALESAEATADGRRGRVVVGAMRATLANGHLANPLPFEPTYWTTLYVDHISYAVSDVRKTMGFYAALLGWNNSDMAADATQVSPTFGDGGLVGGAIIRAGGGGGRAAGEGTAAPAPPSATINHISFGMKDWNTEVMRFEFIKRGLTPRNDFTGQLQSYRVEDDGTLTMVDRLAVGDDLLWVAID